MIARMRMLPAIGALLLLGGCLGKMLSAGPPEALYRFGSGGPDTPDQAESATQTTVVLEPVAFAPEIDGDRLLAVHGDSVRYIKGMRWVSGAPGLFNQRLVQSFAVRAPTFRLLPRQGGDIATLALIVDVGRFEVQYADDAMDTAPVVVIEGDATVLRPTDRAMTATHHFVSHVPADQNRGAAIVAAFDTATAQVTSQITDWVKATSATLPMPKSS